MAGSHRHWRRSRKWLFEAVGGSIHAPSRRISRCMAWRWRTRNHHMNDEPIEACRHYVTKQLIRDTFGNDSHRKRAACRCGRTASSGPLCYGISPAAFSRRQLPGDVCMANRATRREALLMMWWSCCHGDRRDAEINLHGSLAVDKVARDGRIGERNLVFPLSPIPTSRFAGGAMAIRYWLQSRGFPRRQAKAWWCGLVGSATRRIAGSNVGESVPTPGSSIEGK